MATNGRYELGSKEWIEAYRAFLEKELTPEDLEGVDHSVSWECTNTPAHLRRDAGPAFGVDTIGWGIRVKDGKFELLDQPLIQADCVVCLPWEDLRASYQLNNVDEGRYVREERPKDFAARRMKAIGKSGPISNIYRKLNIRERLWNAITA